MIPFVAPGTGEALIQKDDKLVSPSGEAFPVIKGIPRFVDPSNYAAAFGLQWKTFAKTQLDSFSKTNLSRERLERCLGKKTPELKGLNVLEVGCGSGRFTELLIEGGAKVHAVDLSMAVEVNKENIGNAPDYVVAQADLYKLPFPKQSFDVVLCLGVIQHTPSSERSIKALWEMVKPGGTLVIDHYRWRINYYSTLTPLFRQVLKRMKPERSQKAVNTLVDVFFPLHWKFRNAPVLNWLLHRVSPLIQYINLYKDQDKNFHYEWSKLETNDQLTDYYKHLKTKRQIRKYVEKLPGVQNIWINRGGNGIEARCTKAKNG